MAFASMLAAQPVAIAAERAGAASRCASVAAGALLGGHFTSARFFPAGPVPDIEGGDTDRVPAHCRVNAELTPTPDSHIAVEVWMPETGWNGRFLGVGNGGFAGAFNRAETARAVRRGYAVATTDTGHDAVGTEQWAVGHPEKVVDFTHRAIHLTAVAGKSIATRYYGNAPHHAYFASCSNGGRQALMEASRYPADYDGIVAGAPAADWVGLMVASFGWNAEVLRASPIPPTKVNAIAAAVLQQCDAGDGVTDGILQDPTSCAFDPNNLQCRNADGVDCLTISEVEGLRKIYAGPRAPDGRSLYPGFSPGGEVGEENRPGWERWILGTPTQPPLQSLFFEGFMRDFVTGDLNWRAENFDLLRDTTLAREKLAANFNAEPSNLSAFADRGGKLILYHGWSDSAIPPLATVRLYERIREAMGAAKSAQFSRLYMVPGMQHCEYGPGAWWFNPISARAHADPRSDMAAALVHWVEQGIAPEALIAVRPVDAASIRHESALIPGDRTALLCPYPQVARYIGSGDPRAAQHFRCDLGLESRAPNTHSNNP